MPKGRDKKYWRDIEELRKGNGPPYRQSDNPEMGAENRPGSFDRRNFLKTAGFTLALATASGCSRPPTQKALTYIEYPEGVVAGVPEFYASTCGGCSAGCGLMVKTRDGRPIKLEGNPLHPLSMGGLCAAGQASILGLYDSQRLSGPMIDGKPANWDEVDQSIISKLDTLRTSGKVRFLTGTVLSPTARAMITRFLSGFADSEHITYDAISSSAIAQAHEKYFGVNAIPRYLFQNAGVILGVDADFLGTWISPVEYAAGYAQKRVPDSTGGMARHIQVEAILTVTGAKADERIRIAPEDIGGFLAEIVRILPWSYDILKPYGIYFLIKPDSISRARIEEITLAIEDRSVPTLVVCGSQDIRHQELCVYINWVLGNYGKTIDLVQPSRQHQGDDRALEKLIDEIDNGEVDALFIWGCNPAYDLPMGIDLGSAIKRIPLSVYFGGMMDETAEMVNHICPEHHYLESWGDAEPVTGLLSLTQPVIKPLHSTRQFIESLSSWMGEHQTFYDILRNQWEQQYFPLQSGHAVFQDFWDATLRDGVFEIGNPMIPGSLPILKQVESELGEAMSHVKGFTVVVYPKISMRDGSFAHNPWMQEMPDPISKISWDNYACLSPSAAKSLEVSEGDIVKVSVSDEEDKSVTVELPAHIQPGQHDNVVAIAMGYGRKGTDRFAKIGPQWLDANPTVGESGIVGERVAQFLSIENGVIKYIRRGASVEKTGGKYTLATTQKYNTLVIPEKLALPGLEKRPIIEETTLDDYMRDPQSGSHPHQFDNQGLWDEHAYTGHRWGMVVDLNRCTGCSACVVACQVENNIPVVGKDEINRHRDLYWMRIDRYYSGDGDNVDVAFQPMLCQQCGNAPCETVCPVLATVHSSEGLNEQIYNRCVGTRYCANNCPYKVRRFNWFNYARQDKAANMVLNPDVTVRSRGVMEKCTFCVQRIQEGKINARLEGRELKDGDITPACAQTCPTKAIIFGDLNDPSSLVAQLMTEPRRYRVLDELNIRPSVGYLRLVRNRMDQEGR